MTADPPEDDSEATAPAPDGRPSLSVDRRGGVRAIGALTGALVAPLARRHGLARVRLLSEWPAIVGPELARRCRPEKLISLGRAAASTAADSPAAKIAAAQSAEKARGPSALRLRVSGAAALEIQHLAPQIVERINAYFGYRAVERLQLVQGPLPLEPAPRRPVALDAAQRRTLETKLADVADEDLRKALGGLGRAVLTGASRKP
jgi:hypothetical protein